MASINGDNIVPNEEQNEKLVPFDFHENECDVIIKTKDKEVHLPSSFLEMVSSPMDFNNNEKNVFDVDVCAESVTKALSFYHPKDWTNEIKCSELDDLHLVANTLKLKLFKLHLIERMKTKCKATSQFNDANHFNASFLQIFHVAQKYGLTSIIKAIRSRHLYITDYNFKLFDDLHFTALEKRYRCEILQTSVMKYPLNQNSSLSESTKTELSSIFHLFKLIIHKFQRVDLSSKTDFLTQEIPEHLIDPESISYKRGSPDCVVLDVENKEIHVSSYLLINNSPVFKAMLQSTNFKEGQNRRIELPGKKFNEVVYFLQHLHSLQDINDDTNIWALAHFCQEYQVDWLSDKIKSFIQGFLFK
ncbi:uncharacterized protein [Clytia hemisphaerica]|uniref:BTB domain-containing protein n=1 Tax=Clytia hemisphaerica TaxID=252671 RepID=A0A7M5WI88_9CNID